jgi:hypothetical protein
MAARTKSTANYRERLLAMLLIEQNDEWGVNKRYFSLESMELLETSLGQDVPTLEPAA